MDFDLCIRSGLSVCRSPARCPWAGGWPASSIRRPSRVGKGIDAIPMALLRAARPPRAGQDGLEAVRLRLAGLQRRALRDLLRILLYVQSHLPLLNPDGKGSLAALGYKDTAGVEHPGADTAVIFNTVCSFVTNTNLQHYSGEQHLSYFSQLGAIVWLQFVTPACGLAVMLAVIRGLRGERAPGRLLPGYASAGSCFVLVPLAADRWRSLLVATGVPMTFDGAVQATHARAGHDKSIAVGPVAAEVAIKQLGTNGGGFFGPNSAHPFENPSPWSNLLEVVSIIIVPMASHRDVRADDQGPGARDGDLRRDAGLARGRRMASRSTPSSSPARPRPGCRSRRRPTWRARRSGSGRSPRRPGRR